jgi:hypothetical protein
MPPKNIRVDGLVMVRAKVESIALPRLVPLRSTPVSGQRGATGAKKERQPYPTIRRPPINSMMEE